MCPGSKDDSSLLLKMIEAVKGRRINKGHKMNNLKEKDSTEPALIAAPIMVMLLLLAAVILSVGYAIWQNYRDRIMNNHKEELLLISEALADNMEASVDEFQRTLDFLGAQQEKAGSFEEASEFFRDYLEARGGMERDILPDSTEKAGGVLGTELKERQLVTRISETDTIWLCTDREGRHLFLFRKELADTGCLCLAIDGDLCYQKWLADVQIGSSGYIMVKNSSGIILMHPQDSQWGIHVIHGRKERYPDLDLSSLEEMVQEQNRGENGISEYYSYWWLEQPLVKVHKISGYAPVHLGDDFWVISSVVDYDDYNAPIESGFSRISLLFAGSLAAIVIMLLFVSSLLIERHRSRQEIASLRALNERLETIHRMEERIGHQQRLQVIGTMTGGIAHEFNNLLTPIMGYSELLMLELPENSDAYDNALEIYDASEKAREVVRQLSTLSRRNVETVFKKEDPRGLLQKSCKMMRSICPANIQLEEDFSLEEGTAILCNTTQISQVLLNLCVNAIHAIHAKDEKAASAEGMIRIHAQVISRQELEKIPQMANREIPEEWDSYLQIRMEDNGCGMSPEIMRQIFTPFFTTKKTGEGTGLGLALAEQTILSHRGFIFADSVLSEGSVFTICLPVMSTSSQEQDLEMFTAAPQAKRVLIADDNAKILDMLRKSFAKLNVRADICRTHGTLKKLLDQTETDVLLIDETLEDGSGIDFCMSIQGLYPRMIKIVMADYPTHILLEAKQRGIIDGYLLKPFSDTDAVEEIRRCSRPTV